MTLWFILVTGKMVNKKIGILVVFIVFFLLFSSVIWFFNFYKPLHEQIDQINNDDGFNPDEETPVLTVDLDRYNKTITVLSVEKGTHLLWSNVEIRNGTATLPEGSIDPGDVITDCIGFLDFVWKPTMTVFLQAEFVRTGL